MTPRVWQLYDATWQLIYVLHRALEGLALLGIEGKPGSRRQGSLPSLSRGAASPRGSLPQGADKRLASLPALANNHGERFSTTRACSIYCISLVVLSEAPLPKLRQ